MGLDMTLSVDHYVGGWEHVRPEEKSLYATLVEMFGAEGLVTDESPSASVNFTAVYWRKANAIHGWFVRNIQDGKDECQRSWVELESLKELRSVCQSLLLSRDEKEAEAKLAPREGFFFGGYEIDEWYWQSLEYTVKEFDRVIPILEEGGRWEIFYQASW